GQLLRHDRLLERQRVLQLVHGPPSVDEHLEDADSNGMRQRAEEARLERLELAPRHRRRGYLACLLAPKLRHWTIIFKYSYNANIRGGCDLTGAVPTGRNPDVSTRQNIRGRESSLPHPLAHVIDEVAELLPAQGPISIFIHHNTLHAFE